MRRAVWTAAAVLVAAGLGTAWTQDEAPADAKEQAALLALKEFESANAELLSDVEMRLQEALRTARALEEVDVPALEADLQRLGTAIEKAPEWSMRLVPDLAPESVAELEKEIRHHEAVLVRLREVEGKADAHPEVRATLAMLEKARKDLAELRARTAVRTERVENTERAALQQAERDTRSRLEVAKRKLVAARAEAASLQDAVKRAPQVRAQHETLKSRHLAAKQAADGVAPPSAADTAGEAAEQAYLRAYFREKELKDFAGAEKAYAAVVEQFPAERGVVARALLGRLRSLLGLGRKDDASALVDFIGRDFRDYGPLVADARALLAQEAAPSSLKFEEALRTALRSSGSGGLVAYGDRVVPVAVEELRSASPTVVANAAATLAMIQTDRARAAILDAIRNVDTTYPAQFAATFRTEGFSIEALRAAVESPNAEIRRAAAMAAWGRGLEEDWLRRAILSDPVLVEQLLGPRKQQMTLQWVRLLVAAAGSGPGPARAAALARLRDTENLHSHFPGLSAFSEVSEAFVQDREVLEAAAERVSNWLAGSPAAVRAMLEHEPTAETALNWILWNDVTVGGDPGRFVEALERNLAPLHQATSATTPQVGGRLGRALGSPPRAEHVGRVAALLTSSWEGEGIRLLAEALAARGADATAFRALVENLRWPGLQLEAVGWADDSPVAGGRDAQASGVLHGALASASDEVRNAALTAIAKRAADGKFDVQPFVDRAAVMLDDPQTAWAAAAVLRFGGERGAKELVRRLGPAQPALAAVLSVVAVVGDASAAPSVEAVLADHDDPDVVHAAASALLRLRGRDAVPALRQALERDDGKFVRQVALAATAQRAGVLGAAAATDLLVQALDAAPGKLGWYVPDPAREPDQLNADVSQFPATERRRLALAALQSPSFEDRRWGAAHAVELLDPDAWDALLVAAEDLDAYVRDKARLALSKIVANQEEMQRYRVMGEQRAARVHAEKLLRSKDPQERYVGIAAVLALRIDSLVPVLIQLAAEDPTPPVAEEARKALLTLGAAAAGAR